jgi:hypothetical protein
VRNSDITSLKSKIACSLKAKEIPDQDTVGLTFRVGSLS